MAKKSNTLAFAPASEVKPTLEDVKLPEVKAEEPKLDVALEVATPVVEKVVKKLPEDYITGSADYPIRHANIPTLHAAVKAYMENGTWVWKLYDYLSIGQNGKLGKKFGEVKSVLSTFTEEPIVAFLADLNLVTEKKPEEVVYVKRPEPLGSEERKARQLVVAELLKTVEGLTEIEISRMVKAI